MHIFRDFADSCLLRVVRYDSVLPEPWAPPLLYPPGHPPCRRWPLFISYKALKESDSEELRLHSEEMGKLKWGWD